MTATIHARNLDHGGAPACLIGGQRSAAEPRLHLLDLDNLHGGPAPALLRVDEGRALYDDLIFPDVDLGYVAVNSAPRSLPCTAHARVFRVRQQWRPFTVRPASGPDGADLRLLDDGGSFLANVDLADRFHDVVIGSGDRIFSELAYRFRSAGLTVHLVVERARNLARPLHDASTGCVWVLEGGGCLRHPHPTSTADRLLRRPLRW